MFSGPYFLHIYAGHLPHLALMPWVPLLFLSIDGCFDDARNYRWWLLGAFVFAMMLLAGHPQYVYYTGMAAAVYVILNLIHLPSRDGMIIVVRDPGSGFDPAAIPTPTVGQNIYSNHGRGIFLINQLMDEVKFLKNGTEIHMVKR